MKSPFPLKLQPHSSLRLSFPCHWPSSQIEGSWNVEEGKVCSLSPLHSSSPLSVWFGGEERTCALALSLLGNRWVSPTDLAAGVAFGWLWLLLFFTPTGCGYLPHGSSPTTLSSWHSVYSWKSQETSLLTRFSDLGGLVPAQTLPKSSLWARMQALLDKIRAKPIKSGVLP